MSMEPFALLDGVAAPLAIDNIDTDAIIPSRETQSVARSGYGEKLFANWRYTPGTRIVNSEFVLNRSPYDHAVILLAGDNFGCGSSREAAVWALKQFGFRAIVAESYGAIFYNNCIRNGILPIVLARAAIAELLRLVEQSQGAQHLRIDLERCEVGTADLRFGFEIAARDREMLLSGADEIDLTLRRRGEIEAFRDKDRGRRPWLYHARAKELR